MSSDIERLRELRKIPYDKLEADINALRKETQDALDTKIAELNAAAEREIAALYQKQPDLKDERYPTTEKEER